MSYAPAAIEIRRTGEHRRSQAFGERLRLGACGDGWSLVTPGGEVVFRAQGVRARRACLEFAHRSGVLAVFS